MNLDESEDGFVKFGDNYRVKIHGRGNVVILQQDEERIQFDNVLFILKLCVNILSLRRLDEEGYKMIMHRGHLTIYD